MIITCDYVTVEIIRHKWHIMVPRLQIPVVYKAMTHKICKIMHYLIAMEFSVETTPGKIFLNERYNSSIPQHCIGPYFKTSGTGNAQTKMKTVWLRKYVYNLRWSQLFWFFLNRRWPWRQVFLFHIELFYNLRQFPWIWRVLLMVCIS